MIDVPDRALCADAARDRDDPLGGTAVASRRWLLIEHPGPWEFDAFGGSGIALDVRAALVEAVQATRTRLLLVRRPGRPVAGAPRSWAVLDRTAGAPAIWGTWAHDDDLREAASALTDPPPSPSVEQPPVLLVCTHGRHDTCCAVRGRPVAAALARRWPESTWECSHVGGDRFAANLVIAPDGTYYGNLDADNAVGVVESHLAGAVSAPHLRGISAHPPVVQAAVVAAHEQFGPAGPRDVVDFALERLTDSSWRVTLTGIGPFPPTLTTVVSRRLRPRALLTCRASGEAAAAQWETSPFKPPRVDGEPAS